MYLCVVTAKLPCLFVCEQYIYTVFVKINYKIIPMIYSKMQCEDEEKEVEEINTLISDNDRELCTNEATSMRLKRHSTLDNVGFTFWQTRFILLLTQN